jgi:hypothetical protein
MDLTGETGDLIDLVATAPWTLSVTGSADASNVNVAFCDAQGGSEVTAAGRSINGGNNFNWTFIPWSDAPESPSEDSIERSTTVIYEILQRQRRYFEQKREAIRAIITMEERVINTELYDITSGPVMLIKRPDGFKIDYWRTR